MTNVSVLAMDAPVQVLTVLRAYELVVIGIAVSIVLPVLRRLLPNPGTTLALTSWWPEIRPYVGIGAVSLVAAVIVLAFAGDAVKSWSWQSAILAGYAWDSTLQRVGKS